MVDKMEALKERNKALVKEIRKLKRKIKLLTEWNELLAIDWRK
jgi:cell division protein FtsB